MSIIAREVNSNRFHYDGRRRFVAEASDFGPLREAVRFGHPFLSQAFDDAADVGFRMVSAKTGKSVLFTLTNTIEDNDGDVSAWEFESYRLDPPCTAIIFND